MAIRVQNAAEALRRQQEAEAKENRAFNGDGLGGGDTGRDGADGTGTGAEGTGVGHMEDSGQDTSHIEPMGGMGDADEMDDMEGYRNV